MTGESGAGKSVLVQALSAVLGAPAFEGSVRPPAEFAAVEGVLQLSSSAQVLNRLQAEGCSSSDKHNDTALPPTVHDS